MMNLYLFAFCYFSRFTNDLHFVSNLTFRYIGTLRLFLWLFFKLQSQPFQYFALLLPHLFRFLYLGYQMLDITLETTIFLLVWLVFLEPLDFKRSNHIFLPLSIQLQLNLLDLFNDCITVFVGRTGFIMDRLWFPVSFLGYLKCFLFIINTIVAFRCSTFRRSADRCCTIRCSTL